MKTILIAALLSSPLAAQPAIRSLDLSEAYRLSLARSERVAQSGETYQEILAKADELWSNFMPRVSLMGTQTFQHVPKGASTFFVPGSREQGWVTAHQPLFSGLRAALLDACPVRLRPILMTSTATIMAAVPTALGRGAGSEATVPMALALIGGVAVSTLLTLFVVPPAYSLLAWFESSKSRVTAASVIRAANEAQRLAAEREEARA
ncbi:MAG: efflux RND transporter permease subunit [Elusimicrobiota bacterium]|mgnify:FL=1